MPLFRARGGARFIAEDAEVAEHAEKGDMAPPRPTRDLRVLGDLRVLCVETGQDATISMVRSRRP